MTTTQSLPEETVRILIPDHPDLVGVVSGAVEFGAALRHANDRLADSDTDPWRLPDRLTDPALDDDLMAIFHPWGYDLGEDRDTGIGLRHAGTGHMPVYIATATHAQLARLAAAAADFTQAEATPQAQRTPLLSEIVQFASAWRAVEEDEGCDASLRSWRIMLGLLEVSTATAPESDRPRDLLAPSGRVQRLPQMNGTSPAADTATVLAAIDAAGAAREATLDDEAFAALRRLHAEWHAAIYRDKAARAAGFVTSLVY